MELENKIQILDDKITTLLEEVMRRRSENASLQEQIARNQEEAQAQAEEMLKANEAIQSELDAARQELSGKQDDLAKLEDASQANATREEDVRNRLRSIIEKIDAMEQADNSTE